MNDGTRKAATQILQCIRRVVKFPGSPPEIQIESTAKIIHRLAVAPVEAERYKASAAARELRTKLIACRECCLFADDDDQIGVTEDPHIPAELFDAMCKTINKTAAYAAEQEGEG